MPYDPELLENWTIFRLQQELRNRNITFRTNTRRMELVHMLQQNPAQVIEQVNMTNSDTPENTQHSTGSELHVIGNEVSQNPPQVVNVNNNNNNDAPVDSNDGTKTQVLALAKIVGTLQGSVSSLQNCYSSLDTKMSAILARLPFGNAQCPTNIPTMTATDSARELIQQQPLTNNINISAAAGSESQLQMSQQIPQPTNNIEEFDLTSAYKNTSIVFKKINNCSLHRNQVITCHLQEPFGLALGMRRIRYH